MSGVVETIAGTGEKGFGGEGGPAANALLSSPSAVAIDSSGIVYIADTENHRVRKLLPDGTLVTVAGADPKWEPFSPRHANKTRLNLPWSVVVDAAGSVYIADSGNHVVRKVALDGTIATVAGTGRPGYDRAFEGRSRGAGVKTDLLFPTALTIDFRFNLYVAEGNRIRRLSPDGEMTIAAGTGAFGFDGDGAAAIYAELRGPKGLAVDGDGTLYIADTGNHRVRRVTVEGTIDTIAGTGEPAPKGPVPHGHPLGVRTPLLFPSGLAVDSRGEVYFSEGNRIRCWATNGTVTKVAGVGAFSYFGDGGPADDAEFRGPKGLAFDAGGNLYLTDTGNHRVRRIAGVAPQGRLAHFPGRRR